MAMDSVVAVDVNEKSLTLCGATHREALLGPITRYWLPDNCEVFLKSLEAVFIDALGYQVETKMLTFDGREIDVLFSLLPRRS